ncbi:MAG: MOSC domain-containing protein [Planctomycetota bacterium]
MGIVTAVCRGATHSFSKPVVDEIRLIVGLGIAGHAHCGATVQHRSRVAVDPQQPNLRQVHLIHAELHDELQAAGFRVSPGTMGENITTRGIELLALPAGTALHVGDQAVVEVTGLRNPCAQLDAYQDGLMAAVLDRDAQGQLIRKAGIMGVVRCEGAIRGGDPIRIVLPSSPHRPLDRV